MNQKIIENSKKYFGKPYVWGGESMKEGGYDCSGFVYNVLNDSGIKVSRDNAQGYYNRFKDNDCNLDIPGALIFFGKSKKSITHVAINIDGLYMYESIGTKRNTKDKPGKGVTKSLIIRRKDLIAVCNPSPQPKNVSRETLVIPQPTIRRGNMGVKVSQLQSCLNRFCYGLVIDGQFGSKTSNALKDFQRKNGLVQDSIYGKHTYNKMRELLWK